MIFWGRARLAHMRNGYNLVVKPTPVNTTSIIVEANGKQIQELDNHIAIFSPTDEMTGRRYVKSLEKIVVRRVE